MSDYTIYALKGDSDWADKVHKSLTAGEGRFGWSYCEANLHSLRSRIEAHGWASLSSDERDCYQVFLLDLKPDDYVVYVNVPSWGKCTLARVTGPYYWKAIDTDFNHCFGIDPSSLQVFDRNDAIVHPSLSARLKLQGRYWRIYLKQEFEALVDDLKAGAGGTLRTSDTNFMFLAQEVRPLLSQITERIHHTYPNSALEGLVAETFKGVPGVLDVRRQGGATDHGADIVVIFESGLPVASLRKQQTCVVQVKSFEDEHWDTTAVDDIRRAFAHYPDADSGLIVSTATKPGTSFEVALDKVRADTGKPVGLLIGPDVATFLLRFGGHLFG